MVLCDIINMISYTFPIISLIQVSRRSHIRISYQKLWHMMRNNKMKKGDLATAAEISSYSMSKLNREEPVSLEIIMRLCKIIHCDIGDLIEITEEM